MSKLEAQMKRYALLLGALILAASAAAQRHEVLVPDVRTLRVEVEGRDAVMPVVTLGSAERLRVSFDDMTHVYRRHTYHVEHLAWDFSPSTELLESDYVQTTRDEGVIDDYDESMNTTVDYTHYRLTLPNADCRPLLSGNYRLTISREDDDGEPQEVARIYFAMVDTKATVTLSPTTDTDIDRNASHQQVDMEVNLGGLSLRDASEDVRVVVMQNHRWDNAVQAPAPTHVNGSWLVWDHCRALIFPAGNEYRAFEMLSTDAPGMHMDGVHWIAPFYHATLQEDAPRRNYLLVADRNGESVIRNWEDADADTQSDYAMVHFTLAMDELPSGTLFLNGQWTHDRFTPELALRYDVAAQAYVADVLMKTGYYSYQYLCVDETGRGSTAAVEGDFFQTENEYTALVYYHKTGDRYWQLVATTSPSYKP